MRKNTAEKLLATDSGLRSTVHLRNPDGLKRGGYRISGYEAVFFLLSKVATAKLSPDGMRVVYLRLRTDIRTARARVSEMLSSLTPQLRSEDCKTYRRQGSGYELHVRHCQAYLNCTHQLDFQKMKLKEEQAEAKRRKLARDSDET